MKKPNNKFMPENISQKGAVAVPAANQVQRYKG
jgi:hypothetical protein